MRKRKRNKRLFAALLSLMLVLGLLPVPVPGKPMIRAKAAIEPDDSVSLKYVSTVAANVAGSVLRVYGDADATYNIPINITANCTVLLDNVKNTATLTVASGVQATVIVRGMCRLGSIRAVGGAQTTLNLQGEDGQGTLTTGNIAYANGGAKVGDSTVGGAETGAYVNINGCTVVCSNIGSGGAGTAWYYVPSGATYGNCYATQGGCASPKVTITDATVSVSGSIACGGAGAQTTSSFTYAASAGGTSGQVVIANSYVTVGGSVAIGGKGGDGTVGGYYYSVKAGITQSSSNVTITNGSVVTVTGNVGTQQDLSYDSDQGTQAGLNGVTVTVQDSTLTCKDLASGGKGIGRISFSSSTNFVSYN